MDKDVIVWYDAISVSVDSYLNKDINRGELISSIEKYLKRITHINDFEVTLVKTKKPFIMAVYPDDSELEKGYLKTLVDAMHDKDTNVFLEKWRQIKKWHVEIDEKILLLGDMQVMNGEEFTAILAHELGHVFISSPIKMKTTYAQNKASFNMLEKLMLSNSRLTNYLFLPLFLHCLNFRVVISKLGNPVEEIRADAKVPKQYQPALISYMSRCVIDNIKCQDVIKSDRDDQADYEVGVRFTRDAIDLMRTRKDILKRTIQTQYALSESPTIKKFMNLISKRTSAIDIEKNTNKLDLDYKISKYLEDDYVMAKEQVEQILESTKVTDRDLMILEVEKDNIQSTDDKLYLIHTIYDYMETVEKELSKRKDKPNPSQDSRIQYLMNLKNEVMAAKVKEKSYGVFIKYPNGYEG